MKKLILIILIFACSLYGNTSVKNILKKYENKAGINEINELIQKGINSQSEKETEIILYKDGSFDYIENAQTDEYGFYQGEYVSMPKDSTPLIIASIFGYNDIATLLIHNGAEPDVIAETCGQTPLMSALNEAETEMATMLIEMGADLDAKDNEGKTILMKAVIYNYTDIAKTLIEAGADINAKDNNDYNALMYDIDEGDEK